MKLSTRVGRMADGLEREGTRLATFLESNHNTAWHVACVFDGNRLALEHVVEALRSLAGAEKALVLANIDRLVDELKKEFELQAALSGVEIGGTDTVLAGLENDALLAYGKAQKIKQVIPQLQAMRRLGESDQ